MFFLVFIRPEQCHRECAIAAGIATAMHCSGQDTTGDAISLASNEKFWGGSNQSIHTKSPTIGIHLVQATKQCTYVYWLIELGNDISRQNNFVEFASGDSVDGVVYRCLPCINRLRTWLPRDHKVLVNIEASVFRHIRNASDKCVDL
jgi:hypothetical protein